MYEIVSDGSLDLGLDRSNELGVHVVPFYVSPDGGENHKKEIIELGVRDFYQYLIDNPTIFPKTSMPSLQDYLDVLRKKVNKKSWLQLKDEFLAKEAHRKWISFQDSLNFIAARIPAQTL